MAVLYSLACHKKSIGKKNEDVFYARAQSNQTVSKEEIAKYAVAHYGTLIDYTDVLKVIDMLQMSIVDKLKDGCQVSLGELGTFYYHIESESKTASEIQEKGFVAHRDIKDVTIKWKPSSLMKSLKNFGKLELKRRSLLGPRKEAMKLAKQRPDAEE